MTGRVLCVGIAVLDQVWELPALPPGPGKFLSHGFRETGGGMAATAAVAVAALGGAAAWHGRLGADGPGGTLLALLRRHGVEVADVVPAPGGRSPVSGVMVDAEGERVEGGAGRRLGRHAGPRRGRGAAAPGLGMRPATRHGQHGRE